MRHAGERTRWVTLAMAVAAAIWMLACGPSAQRTSAEDAVRTASRGLAEVHGSGGESGPVTQALSDADDWLAQSESAVSRWGSGERSLAWETMAPCLARALRDLRDAMLAEGREVPADLEVAEVIAAAASPDSCPRRGERRE